MRHVTAALGALAMVAAIAVGPANAADDTVTIGAIYPIKTLTGEQGRRSSEFAADQVNASGGVLGKSLKIITYDDNFQPAEGVAAARRLMSEDGVKVVTGGINTAVANAVMQIVEENDGMFMSSVTKSPDLTKHAKGFRLNSLAVTDMGDLTKVLDRSVNPKRVVVVADISDYGKTMIDTLKGIFGDRLVDSEQYQILNQTDFSTIATKVKADNPDVTCLGFVATEQGAAVLRAMKEAGVPGARCIVPGALTPQLITAAGDAAEGAISVDNWTPDLATPENKAFVSAFRAKFNEEPGKVDFLAYQSILILAGAINKAGTATDTDKIADAMRAGTWDGPIGPLTFDGNQVVGGTPVMIQVKDGKIATVQ